MLNVGYSEMMRAYRCHRAAQREGDSSSFCLIRFYAVETGLKGIWLKRTKLHSTRRLVEPAHQRLFSSQGHSLGLWAKELRMPASLTNAPLHFVLSRSDDAGPFGVEQAHEAWRYGAEIIKADERKILLWLNRVIEWIERAL